VFVVAGEALWASAGDWPSHKPAAAIAIPKRKTAFIHSRSFA
jgi:hypothetical protein